jgi:hypothetical protein
MSQFSLAMFERDYSGARNALAEWCEPFTEKAAPARPNHPMLKKLA